MRALNTYAEYKLKKACVQLQALTVDFNKRKFLKEIKKFLIKLLFELNHIHIKNTLNGCSG